mgnify:CR=1 FL=1
MIEGTSIAGHYQANPSSYRPTASMKVQSGGRDVKHRILRLALQVCACVCVLYKTTARGVLSVELIMTTTIRTLYESRAKSY